MASFLKQDCRRQLCSCVRVVPEITPRHRSGLAQLDKDMSRAYFVGPRGNSDPLDRVLSLAGTSRCRATFRRTLAPRSSASQVERSRLMTSYCVSCPPMFIGRPGTRTGSGYELRDASHGFFSLHSLGLQNLVSTSQAWSCLLLAWGPQGSFRYLKSSTLGLQIKIHGHQASRQTDRTTRYARCPRHGRN